MSPSHPIRNSSASPASASPASASPATTGSASARPMAPDEARNRPRITRPKLALITAAALAVMPAAAAISGASPAAASARPAISGTEHFQIISTSATSKKSSVIATGLRTAGGVSVGRSGKIGTAELVFPGGTFKITHRTLRSKGTVNPETCLFSVRASGTYKLSGGTGKYAKISGSGKFVLKILAVDARNSKGKCTLALPPAAYQQVITAHGHVKV